MAIDYYKKAISFDPNNLRAYYNLGLLFGKLKKYNKAINCYENAIKINPNFKEPYALYGNVLLNINKHKEGLEYIKKGCGFIKFNENNFSII
jgi:tetratricopeptide (TPR) repeat protein